MTQETDFKTLARIAQAHLDRDAEGSLATQETGDVWNPYERPEQALAIASALDMTITEDWALGECTVSVLSLKWSGRMTLTKAHLAGLGSAEGGLDAIKFVKCRLICQVALGKGGGV